MTLKSTTGRMVMKHAVLPAIKAHHTRINWPLEADFAKPYLDHGPSGFGRSLQLRRVGHRSNRALVVTNRGQSDQAEYERTPNGLPRASSGSWIIAMTLRQRER